MWTPKSSQIVGAALAAAFAVAACSSSRNEPEPGPGGDVVIIDGERDAEAGWLADERDPGSIPPGHYPPPGECRIWYADRPPGHQPPPRPCDRLEGRVPFGSFLLFGDEAWDTRSTGATTSGETRTPCRRSSCG